MVVVVIVLIVLVAVGVVIGRLRDRKLARMIGREIKDQRTPGRD